MFGTILVILAIAVVGTLVATKFGFVKDDDKNGIPDVVEEKVAEVKEEVKETVKKVKKAAGAAPKKSKK